MCGSCETGKPLTPCLHADNVEYRLRETGQRGVSLLCLGDTYDFSKD